MDQIKKPGFKEAINFWLKLGFISFGGPAGQIAIMHEFLVENKKWISESRFMHALNYCMLLPGPEAQQLATYIGWLLHGVRGGLVAGILFVLPSVLILLGLSIVYVTFGKLEWVAALFKGLQPAVITIIILALLKIGKKSLQSNLHYLIAAASFILIYFFNVPFPIIIFSAIILGFILSGRQQKKMGNSETKNNNDEKGYYLNKTSAPNNTTFHLKKISLQALTGLILWIIPIGIIFFTLSDFDFWKRLTLFFTQAALVTFGGAYAVLPYVAQISVEKLNWLSNLEMLDGLALGETTPGPLIMVLAFVGFMAGYNHYNGSIMYGSLGLLATVFYTFLPCFLFIFIGAPVIERTQDNPKIKIILAYITASVVGVILNLTLYLGEAVIFKDGITNISYFNLIWVLISFVALFRFKINMIWWIIVSAIAGLLHYLISQSF